MKCKFYENSLNYLIISELRKASSFSRRHHNYLIFNELLGYVSGSDTEIVFYRGTGSGLFETVSPEEQALLLPNGEFAVRMQFPLWKRMLFSLAGMKYDRMAARKGQHHHFIFVHENGEGRHESQEAAHEERPEQEKLLQAR